MSDDRLLFMAEPIEMPEGWLQERHMDLLAEVNSIRLALRLTPIALASDSDALALEAKVTELERRHIEAAEETISDQHEQLSKAFTEAEATLSQLRRLLASVKSACGTPQHRVVHCRSCEYLYELQEAARAALDEQSRIRDGSINT